MKCDGNCNHFGICPIGLHDCEIVYLNVGKSHFNVCKKHKVRWHIGWNLFSSWLDETEEQWEHNRKVLEGMRVVEPTRCEDCAEQAEQIATAALIKSREMQDIPF